MELLIIDGVDISNFIAMDGFSWSVQDLDDEESGRELTGDMNRYYVSTKRRVDVKLIPLITEQLAPISQLIKTRVVDGITKYHTVQIFDPREGQKTTFTMYCSGMKAATAYTDGYTIFWNNCEFSLVER